MKIAMIALLACTVLGFTGVWNRLIEGMIFHPSRGADVRPTQLGIDAEDVYLETEDGVRIHSYFLPASDATRALLFLHGNAGNASHRLPNAAQLAALGTHVLLLDYRGYGLSKGRANEAGVYADARAGLGHLVEQQGLPLDRIVVFGRSLGGAVAIDLAAGRELAGLILESTFSSAADVAASAFGGPFRFLAGRRFDSMEKIPRVKAPLLFFHGDRDEIVPFELGRRLFDAAPEPKTFEPIEYAGHNNTVQIGGSNYFAEIGRFLDTVAPR